MTRGVVVCPQPLAAEIGAEILEQGGNAFDAVIAASLGQMVTDAQMCGLGGMGCATIKSGDEITHIGFHARIGAKATPAMWETAFRGRSDLGGYTIFDDFRSNLGHRSVGTPGTVAGLGALHRRARLPWAELLKPAAKLCRDGFATPISMLQMLSALEAPGMPSGLQRVSFTPDSTKLWCRPDGSLKQAGDRWTNADMADTLDRLGQLGPDEFYRGELARDIAAEIERGGGYVTLADLQGYRVRESAPLKSQFRGLSVYTSTPPGGGVTLLQAMRIVERLPRVRPYTPDAATTFALALREAFAERARSVADPEFHPVDLDRLLGSAWVEAAVDRIRVGERLPVGVAADGGGTTHISVYDAEGNAVAMTHTLGMYSGVVVPGTGIPLNSAMDHVDPIPGRLNSIEPGKARLSAMVPTLVFDAENRLRLVNGSPGTNAIVTGGLQVLTAMLDFGCSPHEAVAMPRVHCEGADIVFVEGRISQKAQAALSARGFEVRPFTGNYIPSCGRNQLIAISPDGGFVGASDPRRDGGVAAYSWN